MDFRSKLFVYVFLADTFSLLCLGQFENTGMLGGLSRGDMNIGGIGMNGGALSTGFGLAAMGITPTQYAILDKAVKQVVGQNAKPDAALIAFARVQGGTPTNIVQMMGYIPYFQNIARTSGMQPKQTGTGTNQIQSINDIILQRSLRLMQNYAALKTQVAPAF